MNEILMLNIGALFVIITGFSAVLFQITRLLKKLQPRTAYSPVEKEFKLMLAELEGIDIESKIQIARALLGGQTSITISTAEQGMVITSIEYEGTDIKKMHGENKSIG